MNCKRCGRELNDGAISCDYCGEYVVNEQQQPQQFESFQPSEQPQAYQQSQYSSAPYESFKQPEADYIQSQVQYEATSARSENIITGVIGALVGAAIGAIVIILIGQLGFIASISGAILAFCTLKGYELLGHRVGIAGTIICLLLIALTPYFADRVVWALQLIKEFEAEGMSITFSEAYSIIPDLIKEGFIEKSAYIKDLLMLYVFAVLGGFGTIRDTFRR